MGKLLRRYSVKYILMSISDSYPMGGKTEIGKIKFDFQVDPDLEIFIEINVVLSTDSKFVTRNLRYLLQAQRKCE